MRESEFLRKWKGEKRTYKAWGDFVVDVITESLVKKGKNLDIFLKTKAKCRLKDDASLIDKAYYRPDKEYRDPYTEIEDKVGVRFVVLLLKDIKEICSIIEEQEEWSCDPCKHFDEDKVKEPLLFTYQSVHYVLRPRTTIQIGEISVPPTTPCEVQIRTLLQHAHAELTHDNIYKARKEIKPEIHRTVAKSMALIETTDGFFEEVNTKLNWGPLQEHGIAEKLDAYYYDLTGRKSFPQKSSIAVWEAFQCFIDENLVDKIRSTIDGISEEVVQIITDQYSKDTYYQQSIVLFIYWMLLNRKNRLLKDWPLSKNVLDKLATDVGVSTLMS